MGELQDKVIVVSGIGPGLGRSIALACGAAGARLIVAARTPARVDALVDELTAAGATAHGVVADITDDEARVALVARALDAHGRLDGLVNNAFVMGPMASADTLRPDDWRAVFEVNVVGTVALSSACATAMAASGGGSIVMINSQAARRGAARRGPYAASKAALLAAAQVLATELGAAGVRVNSVVPGQIWGESLENHYASIAARRGVALDEVVAQVTRDIPLGRITRPEEIAEAVVFLLGDRAAAITGQSLDVNGGNWFS
jgi:NAD(P)-dependent dehydrogenase (short-subunit alcohol dehydrogenase family)